MPERIKAHPSDGYLMRHVRGVIDDWYRIEPDQGEDGCWIAAAGESFVEVKR